MVSLLELIKRAALQIPIIKRAILKRLATPAWLQGTFVVG